MTRAARGAAGFTLVELMVSMLLFSVVMAGLSSVMIATGRAGQRSARIHSAQGGIRAALEYIARDLRMAAAGASSGRIAAGSGAPAEVRAIDLANRSDGPDRIDLVLIDPSAQAVALRPFDGREPWIDVSSASTFVRGDTIQICDLHTATLLEVKGVTPRPDGARIHLAPVTNPLPVADYPAGSYVFRSRRVSYFVDTTIFGAGDPLLMRDPDGPGGPRPAEPLAEGIEDLQIALGVDLDGDGTLRSVGAAPGDDEWIYNVPGEEAPPTLDALKAVRVTLVARSSAPETGATLTRPAAEDHAASTVQDGYLRRVLHSEIAPRNLNL